jgi:hypothetical protein
MSPMPVSPCLFHPYLGVALSSTYLLLPIILYDILYHLLCIIDTRFITSCLHSELLVGTAKSQLRLRVTPHAPVIAMG